MCMTCTALLVAFSHPWLDTRISCSAPHPCCPGSLVSSVAWHSPGRTCIGRSTTFALGCCGGVPTPDVMARIPPLCAGEMSDAAEVLGALCDSLERIAGGAELVDACFGLRVRELLHCAACSADTHASGYTQRLYNVSATGLRFQGAAAEPDALPPSLVRLCCPVARLPCSAAC